MITNAWPSQRRHRGDQKSRCPSQKLIWPEAWHLSFSHGRRLTPLPRLRPSNIYASAFSLCWEDPAAADRGWRSASDCPLTQKQSEACVNTNALPSPPRRKINNTSKTHPKAMAYECTRGRLQFPELDGSRLYSNVGPDAFSDSSTLKCIIRLF